jgi:hypothetical protein
MKAGRGGAEGCGETRSGQTGSYGVFEHVVWNRRGLAQNAAVDSIFEARHVEVEKQTKRKPPRVHVADELVQMHIVDEVNGFDLNDKEIIDDEIEDVFTEGNTFV